LSAKANFSLRDWQSKRLDDFPRDRDPTLQVHFSAESRETEKLSFSTAHFMILRTDRPASLLDSLASFLS
jgi:hypothetical protein